MRFSVKIAKERFFTYCCSVLAQMLPQDHILWPRVILYNTWYCYFPRCQEKKKKKKKKAANLSSNRKQAELQFSNQYFFLPSWDWTWIVTYWSNHSEPVRSHFQSQVAVADILHEQTRRLLMNTAHCADCGVDVLIKAWRILRNWSRAVCHTDLTGSLDCGRSRPNCTLDTRLTHTAYIEHCQCCIVVGDTACA